MNSITLSNKNIKNVILDARGVFMPTNKRIKKVESVVAGRTHNLLPVLEHVEDTGNSNACIRSAEAFGCQDVHIIERTGAKYYKGKRTSSGATKWLDVHKWQDTATCLNALKQQGYQVVVTTLKPGAVPIHQIDFSVPTAILLGNEHEGASQLAESLADHLAYIPMSGFVESFNISVACALSLYTAVLQRGDNHADMTDKEQQDLVKNYLDR